MVVFGRFSRPNECHSWSKKWIFGTFLTSINFLINISSSFFGICQHSSCWQHPRDIFTPQDSLIWPLVPKFWLKPPKKVTLTNFFKVSIVASPHKSNYSSTKIFQASVLIGGVQNVGFMVWSYFDVFWTSDHFFGPFLGTAVKIQNIKNCTWYWSKFEWSVK